jgi:fructokinase
MTPKLTVFGEVLWDVLPDTRLAGGATMNVAAHLQRYGLDVSFISRVGHDELGAELLEFMKGQGLSTDFVQTGETHLTGIAKANVSDSHEVTYKILHPVAWDYIQYDALAAEKVAASDYFVYGSLAARDDITRLALLRYLKDAHKPVFDVNLRPPHYTREGVLELLGFARIVKMNEHELVEVARWIGEFDGEREAMALVMDRYRLDMLVLTCGEQGAMVLTPDGQYHQHPGFVVQVADTIGSGDAFLGAFLFKTANGHPVNEALEFACAAGAYVAGKTGALPVFAETDIEAMIRKQSPAGQVI